MNKAGVLYLLVALIAGIAGYLLFQARHPDEPADSLSRNGPADAVSLEGTLRPDFTLPDLEGRQRSPAEWNGKVLILNFWASWCPPCLTEIPAFIRLQEKYADRDVQFVGIALQQAEEVRDFVAGKGINYPVLAGVAEVIKVAEAYGNLNGTLPYTVIISRGQAIVYIKRGPLSEAEAERMINAQLPPK